MVAVNFCALDSGVDKGTNTTVLDCVILHKTAGSLSVQSDEITRDVVARILGVGLVVHAHDDEQNHAGRGDGVALCKSLCRANSDETVLRTVDEFVVRHFDVVTTNNRNVLTQESANFKATTWTSLT